MQRTIHQLLNLNEHARLFFKRLYKHIVNLTNTMHWCSPVQPEVQPNFELEFLYYKQCSLVQPNNVIQINEAIGLGYDGES